MKQFKELDPILHSQLRLSVVSLLIGLKEAEFTFIKEKTGATPGNLSVQLEKLHSEGYITIEKTYKGKRPLTICRMSKKGIVQFDLYVKALQEYLQPNKKNN